MWYRHGYDWYTLALIKRSVQVDMRLTPDHEHVWWHTRSLVLTKTIDTTIIVRSISCFVAKASAEWKTSAQADEGAGHCLHWGQEWAGQSHQCGQRMGQGAHEPWGMPMATGQRVEIHR